MSRRLITLDEAVAKVVKQHGGIRATERATGIDKGFLSRMANGKRTAPSDETLMKLGLRPVALYEIVKDSHDHP